MDVEKASTELAAFLGNNPSSSVEHSETFNTTILARPWGDSSLVFEINYGNANDLFAALNSVVLPERFIAISHCDTHDLEIIYTAFPLHGDQEEVKSRKFEFTFKGKTHVCEFARCSERLLTIARSAKFIGPSTTDHRNLPSFVYFVDAVNADDVKDWSPVCFWIRGVEWNAEDVVDLASHLNFYMSYYDTRSPNIRIFAPKKEIAASETRERFIAGKFPKTILGTELNSNLMHFWNASRYGDMFRRFLYGYQILEFASFYFIEDSVRQAVKRTLATPHINDEIDSLIVSIIDDVQKSRIWEGNKMEALLEAVVKWEIVWREVEKNKEYFSSKVDFEGGFQSKPFVIEKVTDEIFRHDWHKKFAGSVRQIRNALSHGKEQHMSSVIAPTDTNFVNLQPWGDLMSVVAGEVVVYYKASL
jgi:hypothetical protein